MALQQVLEWEGNYGFLDCVQTQYLNHPGKADATLVINKIVKQRITEAKLDYI